MLLCNSGGRDFRTKSQLRSVHYPSLSPYGNIGAVGTQQPLLLSPSAPLIPPHGAVLSPKNDFVLNYTLSSD